jgi:hypothetical protein
MPNIRTFRTSFVGGEVSPELYGRLDLDKEQSGLALCQNFFVLPHGPAQSRGGLHYVNTVKNPGGSVPTARLIPFSFSSSQTLAIEMGGGYFRFYTNGQWLQAPAYSSPGPQLLGDAAFAAGTAWSSEVATGATLAFGANDCVMTNSGAVAPCVLFQSFPVAAGVEYALTVAATATASGLKVYVGSTGLTLGQPPAGDLLAGTLLANGTTVLNFTATETTTATVALTYETSGTATLTGVGVQAPGTNVYNAGVAYSVGALVYDSGSYYYCTQAGTGQTPAAGSAYWYALTGNVYEIPNPYQTADLFNIHYVQSGDIVTFVHPDYAPMQLERYADLDWVFAPIGFASSLSAPATPSGAAYGGTAAPYYPQNKSYVITALDQYGQEESLPSGSVTLSNDLTDLGRSNSISWTGAAAGAGVGYYNVYASDTGSYGFVGQVANKPGVTVSFTDTNITPDQTQTYPTIDTPTPLSSADNFPGAVGYYEQRRVFGGTNSQPQNLWLTQPGTESNLNYSVPSQGSDALRIRIAALRANLIEHVLPLLDLIVLTASTEWRVYTPTGDALTPSTIAIKAQSQNGASNVQPVMVNNAALYAAATGGHMREISYDWQIEGYLSSDVCLLATHLFNGHTIVDMAFSRSPYPIVWAVNDQGKLLGLTYVPEQQVRAWHQHVTGADDAFESCCVIHENGFDVLYVVVRRTVNGAVTRYIERLDTRQYDGVLADAFFVDAGINQVFGTPTSVVTGLTWLAGATVSALLDGKAVTGLAVSTDGTGTVTLPYAASNVTIGLPINAVLETLPVSVAGDNALGQGRIKNVNKVWARCVDFCGCEVGPNLAGLVPVGALVSDSAGNPALANGEFRVSIMPEYDPDGSVVLVNDSPLPITVCDVTIEVAVGA